MFCRQQCQEQQAPVLLWPHDKRTPLMRLCFSGPQPRLCRTGNKSVFVFFEGPKSRECLYCVCLCGLRKSSSKDAKMPNRWMPWIASCCRISAHRLNPLSLYIINTRHEWLNKIRSASKFRSIYPNIKVQKWESGKKTTLISFWWYQQQWQH